jgi:hypothetical protein
MYCYSVGLTQKPQPELPMLHVDFFFIILGCVRHRYDHLLSIPSHIACLLLQFRCTITLLFLSNNETQIIIACLCVLLLPGSQFRQTFNMA